MANKRQRKKVAKRIQSEKLRAKGYTRKEIKSFVPAEREKLYTNIVQEERRERKRKERRKELVNEKKAFIKANNLTGFSPYKSNWTDLKNAKRKKDRQERDERTRRKKISELMSKGFSREEAEKYKNKTFTEIRNLFTGDSVFNISPNALAIGWYDYTDLIDFETIISFSSWLSEEQCLKDIDFKAHEPPEVREVRKTYIDKKGKKRTRKYNATNGRAGKAVIASSSIANMNAFPDAKANTKFEFITMNGQTALYEFKLKNLAKVVHAILHNIQAEDRLPFYTKFYKRITKFVAFAKEYFPRP